MRRSYGKTCPLSLVEAHDLQHPPAPFTGRKVRALPRPGFQHHPATCCPHQRTSMKTIRPRTLLLSFSIALALAACGGGADAPPPADTATDASAAAADTPRFTLDESALPPVNRFQASDLDTSVNACQDFNAYANGKWLASNDIPGD